MQHFLDIRDFSTNQLWDMLNIAKTLKAERQHGGNKPLLQGKVLGLLFQKPSLRTRVSFEVGMMHLGGQTIYLSPQEIQLGSRESVPDVARVLSGYVDAVLARVFDHDHVTQLAAYSRVPVINGLSDYSHPCQALTDIFTIWEHFGRLEDITVAYVGDGNNTAISLLNIVAKLGVNFKIGTPAQYALPADALAKAQAIAADSGSQITVTTDPVEAVSGADVLYTDVWTSMGQESETIARLKVFPPYQVNTTLLAQAKPTAIVLHCLPAHRGEEITDEVADGPQSLLFQQAENRLHAQKGILVTLLAEAQIIS